MRDQFLMMFETFLPEAHLVETGLVRGDTVTQMLSEHVEGRVDHGNRLWLLLNAEVWFRVCLEGTSPANLQEQLNDRFRPALNRSGVRATLPARE